MEGRRWGGRVWIGAGVCSDRAGEMAERREWWDGVTGGWMGLLGGSMAVSCGEAYASLASWQDGSWQEGARGGGQIGRAHV